MIIYNYHKKVFEYKGRYAERFDYIFDTYTGDYSTNRYKMYDKYDSITFIKNLDRDEAYYYRRWLNKMDTAYLDEVMNYLVSK